MLSRISCICAAQFSRIPRLSDIRQTIYQVSADRENTAQVVRSIPDSQRFIVSCKDGVVLEYVAVNGNLKSPQLSDCKSGIEQIRFSKAREVIGVLCEAGDLSIMSARTHEMIEKIALPDDMGIDEFNFSPDGSSVVVGSSDAGYIAKYSIDSRGIVEKYVGHSGAVRAITYNNNGTLLAAANEYHQIYVWNVKIPAAHLESWSTLGIIQLTFAGNTRYVSVGVG